MKERRIRDCLAEYNGIIKENDDIYRDLAKIFGLSECGFWILFDFLLEWRRFSKSCIA